MKRHLLYYLIVFIWADLLIPNGALAGSMVLPEKIPQLRINTEQSSLQIGLEIGRKSKKLFPDIERRYDTHLAATLSQDQFDYIQQNSLPKLLKALDPKYREELKGVAGSWSLTRTNKLGDGFLSLQEYQLLNLLPDVGFPPNGTGFGAFGKVAVENEPIVGRNLDWFSTPELRSLQAITIYQNNKKAVVNIGFAGIISVLTGFNERGLYLAYFNAKPTSIYTNIQRLSEYSGSNVFDIRKALETKSSTQEAARYLSKKTYTSSHSILMADKKNIQVLEYPEGGVAKIRHWNSRTRPDKPWGKTLQIAVIDCHVLATLPNNCKDIKDSYRWQRLRQLAQFSDSKPASVKDIDNTLFDTANHQFEIFNSSTLQSMVYQPSKGDFYLYAAAVDDSFPVSPVHKAYLDALPLELNNSQDNSRSYIVWVIGLLLLVMSAIVIWIIW